jgi:hypothetical protein
MKTYIAMGFVLAMLVAPAQVHAQSSKPQPLNINGNVFDPMPSPGIQSPAPKPVRHVKKHKVRSSS